MMVENLVTTPKLIKKYKINNTGRKLWENSLWPGEMWLYFEII